MPTSFLRAHSQNVTPNEMASATARPTIPVTIESCPTPYLCTRTTSQQTNPPTAAQRTRHSDSSAALASVWHHVRSVMFASTRDLSSSITTTQSAYGGTTVEQQSGNTHSPEPTCPAGLSKYWRYLNEPINQQRFQHAVGVTRSKMYERGKTCPGITGTHKSNRVVPTC